MILSKCFKCGGDRVLISNSMQRPDYASHTEDECLIALNTRVSELERVVKLFENHVHEIHNSQGEFMAGTTRTIL